MNQNNNDYIIFQYGGNYHEWDQESVPLNLDEAIKFKERLQSTYPSRVYKIMKRTAH